MGQPRPRTFTAPLERAGRLGWTIVRLPFDSAAAFGTRQRIRVRGEVARAAPRAPAFLLESALFPDGSGRHALLITKKILKTTGLSPGDLARFRLEPVSTQPAQPKCPELEAMLKKSRAVERMFGSFTAATRREIARWVAAGKAPETRRRRAQQMAERLLETLEAERELPPRLAQSIGVNTKARAGWESMTPRQRRMELLGIFYYRTPESRARRIAHAVERMIERAEKRSSASAGGE